MLNSAEHEILNARKYKNIKKFIFFQAQMSLELSYFFLLINVEMPTTVAGKISCTAELSMKFFYNLGARFSPMAQLK